MTFDEFPTYYTLLVMLQQYLRIFYDIQCCEILNWPFIAYYKTTIGMAPYTMTFLRHLYGSILWLWWHSLLLYRRTDNSCGQRHHMCALSYIQHAWREGLQIWQTCLTGLEDEPIRFWWFQVKRSETSQRPPFSSTRWNFFKFLRNVPFAYRMKWFVVKGHRHLTKHFLGHN